MELDHVLLAVPELAAAAQELEARHGLSSVEGGRHPGWGTANRVVPLGDCYLELVSVVDEIEAAASVFGRWVASGVSELVRPLGWAVRTTELDAVARRLGLTVGAGSRSTPAGELLQWRGAGIEHAAAEPSLPFFIEWGEKTPFPGRAIASHRAAPTGISKLVLAGDPERLAGWLGEHALPIVVRAGKPGVASVVVSCAAGEIALGSERP
jgi:hypothetical protein